MVRLWRDAPDNSWRASAQSVQTGDIVRFGTLQALFEFIEAQTASVQRANAPPPDGDANQET
jgi:hypothetical protein